MVVRVEVNVLVRMVYFLWTVVCMLLQGSLDSRTSRKGSCWLFFVSMVNLTRGCWMLEKDLRMTKVSSTFLVRAHGFGQGMWRGFVLQNGSCRFL